MLRRKMIDELLEWKARKGHKSLLLKGQRQVGKTFILKEFGKTCRHCVYFDLSTDDGLCEQFRRSVDIDPFVRYATARGPEYAPVARETLIILDEIQSCPRARTSLKQFTLDGRFDVAASGSLIDVPSKEFEDPRFQRLIMLERSDISVDAKGIEHYPMFAAAFFDDMAGKKMPDQSSEQV